jgi:hypothetical protein
MANEEAAMGGRPDPQDGGEEPGRGPEPAAGREADAGEPEPEPGAGAAGRGPAGQPRELLGELVGLRRRARSARHAYWFPLVLFGLLSCAALPFYRPAFPLAGARQGSGAVAAVRSGQAAAGLPVLGGNPLQGSFFLGYYWLVALVGGYLLCALWYRRHARLAGLQTPAHGYVTTGVVLTVAALLLPPLSRFAALRWLAVLWPGDLVFRGTFPFLIIAAGLCVLAWAERSRVLAATALVYSGAALLASLYDVSNLVAPLGWSPAGSWPSSLANVLLPAAVLLAAGAAAGAGAASRRSRAAA